MEDCIFCKIISGDVPAKILYSSDYVVAFPDISPSADIHILIVPKVHLGGIKDLTKDKSELLSEVYEVAAKLAEENNLEEDLYRVVINGGKAQHVPHLHFHFLGGQWKKMV